jgi:hypothetical protein
MLLRWTTHRGTNIPGGAAGFILALLLLYAAGLLPIRKDAVAMSPGLQSTRRMGRRWVLCVWMQDTVHPEGRPCYGQTQWKLFVFSSVLEQIVNDNPNTSLHRKLLLQQSGIECKKFPPNSVKIPPTAFLFCKIKNFWGGTALEPAELEIFCQFQFENIHALRLYGLRPIKRCNWGLESHLLLADNAIR